jgi:glutamate synthase (NADPH/NADH) small chain
VIEAMGAGRKAAASMKAYLGISDIQEDKKLFGIDSSQHNFARLRAA